MVSIASFQGSEASTSWHLQQSSVGALGKHIFSMRRHTLGRDKTCFSNSSPDMLSHCVQLHQ